MTVAQTMPSKVIATFVSSRTPRTKFDPSQVNHRASYQKFLKSGKWADGCPFKLEWPFLTIPAQCERRMLDFYITQDTDLHK